MTEQQAIAVMKRRNSAEDRFALKMAALRQERGGRPTARLGADGRIEFVYPDGTVTR